MGNFSIKEKYFKFILYLAVIILINIVGITLFFRADLTRDKIYSLSDASKDVVATLSEPLSIKVFFSKNLPAPHNNTERYLRDLLDEYASRGGKFFNYSFYNVTPEEGTLTQKADENRNMAKDYGIQPVQIQIMENDEVKFKNAYMGLVIIHGDLIEKIEAITSTDGLEYKMTTAIRKMNNKVSALRRMKDKVKINMYLSSSLNEVAPLIGLNQLPMLAKAIEDTIEKLNAKSLGILEFNHVDVSKREQLDELAKKYDIMALSWPAVPQKQIAAGQGAAGIVIDFRGETTTLPLISSIELPIIGTTYQMAEPAALEEKINSVVEKQIGINMDLGFLSSHGTHSLMPNQMAMMQGQPGGGMQALNALVSENYSPKPVDLKNDDMPEGLNCIIIPRPTEPFSDYELFQIDQALMKGTNIAFISDAFNQVDPPRGGMGMPPRFEPINTGLEKLLAHYGISMKNAYILDKKSFKLRNSRAARGPKEQILYFVPQLSEDTINNTPIFMDNIKALLTMQAAPLELLPDNIDSTKVTTTKLLSSSDESWLMEGMIQLDPRMIAPPESSEDMKSYDFSYLLSGEFTSYFKGKSIPQKQINEDQADEEETAVPKGKTLEGLSAENTIIETSKPAKIFVLSSSQMLQDNMLDPEGRTTNATFLLNVIDHLNGKDKIAQLRSKQQKFNPLEETTPFFRGIIKAFNIIALPVLVILFGVGVFAKRSARKKKIASRFNA